jgi:predicted nucleotidyltransferase
VAHRTDDVGHLVPIPTEAFPPSLDNLKSKLFEFCRRHGVARLEVFGSVARGEAHRGSDLDLLITFRPEVHIGWEFFSLHEELEEILGGKVDLLTRRSVEQDENSIRRRSILQTTQEIYAS